MRRQSVLACGESRWRLSHLSRGRRFRMHTSRWFKQAQQAQQELTERVAALQLELDRARGARRTQAGMTWDDG